MAQNDIQITTTPPLPGLTLVQGINGALQSLATDFAGSVDPAAIGGVGPYCTWADTGNGLLKRRNAAGTDWVVEGKLLANNSSAENIDYDNAASGLAAETVQDAVDELTSEKLDIANAFGIGQTYQDVTSSRSTGITYTNTSDEPIGVFISATSTTGPILTMYVNGVAILISQNYLSGYTITASGSFIVPPGSTYKADIAGGASYTWFELKKA